MYMPDIQPGIEGMWYEGHRPEGYILINLRTPPGCVSAITSGGHGLYDIYCVEFGEVYMPDILHNHAMMID